VVLGKELEVVLADEIRLSAPTAHLDGVLVGRDVTTLAILHPKGKVGEIFEQQFEASQAIQGIQKGALDIHDRVANSHVQKIPSFHRLQQLCWWNQLAFLLGFFEIISRTLLPRLSNRHAEKIPLLSQLVPL